MMKPKTTYAKSGDISIAYQVFGTGPIDLVYIPGWVSNIDLMWSCPELVSFFEELGKFARVILFDKRGTGLSDRVVDFATLEERMEDITVVMDAVASEKAVLFGHSEGGSVSALFSATYPDRVISLITFGIFAKRKYSEDYPWAPTDQERQEVYDMIENNWGSGEMNLESLAPSKANDTIFMDWLANYFRSGASPKSAVILTKMNTQVDIIDILGSIKVPTLLLQRTDDIDVKIEEGRFIAERIKGSKFVELEGNDHLFWVGNTEEILKEMETFIRNVEPQPIYEKKLYTVMIGKIVSVKENNEDDRAQILKYIAQYNGSLVEYSSMAFTATFEGPSRAVNCATNMVEAFREQQQITLSLGIDIKECYVKKCICEETEGFATTIFDDTLPNQIILTQTVKNLLIGASVNIKTYKTIFNIESGQSLELFTIAPKTCSINLSQKNSQYHTCQNDSFLGKVLQKIECHIDNEQFGVEMLCKEVGISERQLQRKLKSIANKSPNKLISSVRLHRAKELLLRQQHSIAEIAYQAGFANPSYFSKCFKKEFAISPSDLIK
ncbi:alpha/beta fold hydrolase [Aquimarina sp. D1M17]|uniref:alpha/beta fold hydrolase n=1 Tax=Aquimarina acroporae TaxID=2937283 RepID=UPI0020BEC330|nr:alpha/beta fold hydrolase [Aquimarina acroporae]MCK8521302.1 alpha/beta fold hydrolase [Aquimarina acroporae]